MILIITRTKHNYILVDTIHLQSGLRYVARGKKNKNLAELKNSFTKYFLTEKNKPFLFLS